MNIPKEAFSKLEFNVEQVKDGTDLIHHFPEMERIKPFTEYREADRNRIIRYIILMYSRNSPMREYYQDLDKRREACAIMAGFKRNKKGEFNPDVSFLFEMTGDKGEQILKMVAGFLSYKNDRLIAKINSTETAFWEYQKLIFDPIKTTTDSKDKDILSAATTKTKLIEDSDKLDDLLQGYYSKLCNGNEEAVEAMQEKNMFFNPEQLADDHVK